MKKVIKKKAAHKAQKISNLAESKQKEHRIMPLADKVLLRPLSAEEVSTTVSGIIIPDTVHKDKPEQGIVLAIGEGVWKDGKKVASSLKVGDRVIFSRYGYDEVKLDGEELYILKEENILAVIR